MQIKDIDFFQRYITTLSKDTNIKRDIFVQPKEFKGYRPYQAQIVNKAQELYETQNIVAIEVGCGLGKTLMGAAIAKEISKKRILIIAPNKTAIGSIKTGESSGNISNFVDVFRDSSLITYSEHEDFKYEYPHESKRIVFFTPIKFFNIYKKEKSFHNEWLNGFDFIIVDEAHRFPEDIQNDTIVIGQIAKIINDLSKNIKILTLTATHIRTDAKLPCGKDKPDIKYTIADAIEEGSLDKEFGPYCPDICGIPVFIDVKCKSKKINDEYQVITKGRFKEKYFNTIVDKFIQLNSADPNFGHCFFVSRIKDAMLLKEKINKKAGKRVIEILHSGQDQDERQGIIKEINNGTLQGYITVKVGDEAVNIPRLKYCHLIIRTKSIVRLVQSVGRVTRIYPEKDKAVVIDYVLLKDEIINGCLGLWDYAKQEGTKLTEETAVLGGSLFKSKAEVQDVEFTYKDQETWIDKEFKSFNKKLEELRLFLEKHKRLPATGNKSLMIFYKHHKNSKEVKELIKKFEIKSQHQIFEAKVQEVIKIASNLEIKDCPKELRQTIQNMRQTPKYAEVKKIIMKLRPLWFRSAAWQVHCNELEQYYILNKRLPFERSFLAEWRHANRGSKQVKNLEIKYNIKNRYEISKERKKVVIEFIKKNGRRPHYKKEKDLYMWYMSWTRKECRCFCKNFCEKISRLGYKV